MGKGNSESLVAGFKTRDNGIIVFKKSNAQLIGLPACATAKIQCKLAKLNNCALLWFFVTSASRIPFIITFTCTLLTIYDLPKNVIKYSMSCLFLLKK